MPAIVNFPDLIKVGIMAFVFIKLANMGLDKVGLSQFKA